jgi:alpha-L-fucosidase 2
MNYWLSETCNLSEYTEPLLELIEHLSQNGRKTAMLHYGCNGWVAHHNSDIWAHTAPVGPLIRSAGFDCTGYSVWPMSSGWLCRHLWEHYLFTGDEVFLKNKAMPIIIEACSFYLDYLIEDEDGYMVTGLSISPENTYEFGGKHYHIDKMPAMDIAILRELFTNALSGIKLTGLGIDYKETFVNILAKLPDYKLGSQGQLLEWSREYYEPEPHHRHSSHLYCLYPSQEVSPLKTPLLAESCKEALLRRGSEGTGWGQAWKICLWARLYDGDKCYEMLKQIMRPAGSTGFNYSDGSGIYKNMFDAHPPFQIDGNFGASAGIAEMFVQSEPGFIHLLPALPTAFSNGYIKGLCCRGCIVADIYFENNRLDYAILHAKKTQSVRIRLGDKEIYEALPDNQPIRINCSRFIK